MTYTPKGKVVPLLQAIKADRFREFTAREACELMKCDHRAVSGHLQYPAEHGLLFLRKEGRELRIRGTAYEDQDAHDARRKQQARIGRVLRTGKGTWKPEDGDIRIPRVVAGWNPPRMVAPRG